MKDLLLRFIRRSPRSSGACREFMTCSSMETEALLVELRDEGEIAFANGAWYVPDAGRLPRLNAPPQVHPKQLPLFADAQGRRLTGQEQMMERIGDIARAVRRRA